MGTVGLNVGIYDFSFLSVKFYLATDLPNPYQSEEIRNFKQRLRLDQFSNHKQIR